MKNPKGYISILTLLIQAQRAVLQQRISSFPKVYTWSMLKSNGVNRPNAK